MEKTGIAIAGMINIDKHGTRRIWIPPAGRPYWVIAGRPNAGPCLTDEELEKYNLATEKKKLSAACAIGACAIGKKGKL